MGRCKVSVDELVELVYKHKGVVKDIAAELDMSWHGCHRKLTRHESTKQALSNSREMFKDDLEKHLRTRVLKNDDLLKWALSKLARDRGYGENLGNPNELIIDTVKVNVPSKPE